STFTTKMSLSVVAAPGSVLVGVPVPDADAWKAMFLQSGDQVAELPWVRNIGSLPSAFIRNKSEIPWPARRSLSQTIRLPSGDKFAKASRVRLVVNRCGFVPSAFIR